MLPGPAQTGRRPSLRPPSNSVFDLAEKLATKVAERHAGLSLFERTRGDAFQVIRTILAGISLAVSGVAAAQTPIPRTPVGRPDFQDGWTSEFLAPLGRPAGATLPAVCDREANTLVEAIATRRSGEKFAPLYRRARMQNTYPDRRPVAQLSQLAPQRAGAQPSRHPGAGARRRAFSAKTGRTMSCSTSASGIRKSKTCRRWLTLPSRGRPARLRVHVSRGSRRHARRCTHAGNTQALAGQGAAVSLRGSDRRERYSSVPVVSSFLPVRSCSRAPLRML